MKKNKKGSFYETHVFVFGQIT